MKKCPYCGQEVADNEVHCPKCLAGIPHEENKNDKSEEVGSRRNRIKTK